MELRASRRDRTGGGTDYAVRDRAAVSGHITGTGNSPRNFAFAIDPPTNQNANQTFVESLSLQDNPAGPGQTIGGSSLQNTQGSSLYHFLAFLQATPEAVVSAQYKKGTSPFLVTQSTYAGATMIALGIGPRHESVTWKAPQVTIETFDQAKDGTSTPGPVVTYP